MKRGRPIETVMSEKGRKRKGKLCLRGGRKEGRESGGGKMKGGMKVRGKRWRRESRVVDIGEKG